LTLRCFIVVPALALLLAGCGSSPKDEIGQAYIAPATVNVRGQLSQKSNNVAILKHGDLVSIIDIRRRYVKIRTASGVDGWIDSSQLLMPQEMDQIRKERQHALALPSEGSATVYDALNIHLEPNRQSPAFARIPAGASIEVLGYRLAPKTAGPPERPPLKLEKPKPPTRHSRRDAPSKADHLLPAPAPPQPPPNWQQLSAERIPGSESSAERVADRAEDQAEQKAGEEKKPVVMEDWALVRTKAGECGWVLARNLTMSIPDEVAQYAEGKRITSYFDLGSVQDELKGVKHNWLWTTMSESGPYDFDAWRVFLWNRHHHRYETSYRQHDLVGYFPVHVDAAGETRDRTFELIIKDDDGKLRQRTYAFDGTLVHLTGTEDYPPNQSPPPSTAAAPLKAAQPGWLRRQWNALKRRAH